MDAGCEFNTGKFGEGLLIVEGSACVAAGGERIADGAGSLGSELEAISFVDSILLTASLKEFWSDAIASACAGFENRGRNSPKLSVNR